MKKKRSRKQAPQEPFRQQDGAAARERQVNFSGFLENGLIFAALVIVIIAALYILNGQIVRLV